MIGMIIVACQIGTIGACDPTVRRVDVPDIVWPVPMGCVVAAPQIVAQWAEANPGWRVLEVKCVPVERLGAEIAKIEEGA